MPKLMSEEKLRQTAFDLLERELGPVETLRFLALIRREPFDYQAWRADTFKDMTVDELFRRMQDLETRRAS
jgi:hypothetical protein